MLARSPTIARDKIEPSTIDHEALALTDVAALPAIHRDMSCSIAADIDDDNRRPEEVDQT